MASINFNPFGENWFKKPPNPLQPINFHSFAESINPFKHQTQSDSFSSPFAAISISNPFKKIPDPDPEPQRPKPGTYKKMLEQFYWESENRPDYRHTPEVEKILNEDPLFEKKENPTQEEIEENERWMKEFRENPVVQFMARAEEIADELNEMELKANSAPYRWEDKKYWQSIPHVIGPDGRPMPRKAIRSVKESDDKFWDFAKQFFFGLWGFRQRPYPPSRPIDVAQAVGYKRLEKRYYDFIMRSGGFFYKDRIGRTRGPCELIQLKTAWGAGIIDKYTFIWGEDLDEWVPIGALYGMERAIATWEVRLGAAATAFIHKLQKGIPPWVPLKGFENKSRKQLQDEAYESKRRDMAVLEANDGVWPGVRIPSHALFLWASGSELTSILEEDHMPNKYIPKDMRKQLIKAIPGLRPWEVLSVEQAMDQITYGGNWYRERLGTFTTGPPYIEEYSQDVEDFMEEYMNFTEVMAYQIKRMLPGFGKLLAKVRREAAERAKKKAERGKQKIEAAKRAKRPQRPDDDDDDF
ncbi:protein TIC 56, chloroplastic [Cynara cardunculus var. scolymus]|uniref:protein TIC 56, chloroplastic n=1 Tax=Cynara cardunculus var. scolymus TaxID=59895 RepID=UPI000D6253A9|nr:protein TIC 56, chloroplastic [Cynara cardunculus var. scolymus]